MMKKVYICAPLGGDVQGDLEKAKRIAQYALKCGTAPVVPHFYADSPPCGGPSGSVSKKPFRHAFKRDPFHWALV